MQTPSYNADASNSAMTKGHEPSDHSTEKYSSAIAREFHNLVADIEDLLKATTHLTGEDLVKAKAKLQERVAAAKDSIEEMGETVAHRARKTAAVTNNYVHEKPWNAVGIGIFAGVLLGYLLTRRA